MRRSTERTSKIFFVKYVLTIKFYYHSLKARGVHATFQINSGNQMDNNYAPCFNRITLFQ